MKDPAFSRCNSSPRPIIYVDDVIVSSLCCNAAIGPGAQKAWQSANSAGRRPLSESSARRLLLGGPALSNGLYWMYEAGHAALQPARALADVTRLAFKNPFNPLAHTTYGKSMAAAAELFERSTRRYAKPSWGIDSVLIGGERAPINIATVWERPFCRLLHFERMFCHMPRRPQPKLLIVAPMSGHYATLLRGTVEAFLPNHDVYITDWTDARMVPVTDGRFDLDTYIDYVISMLHFLGGDTHVVAVCQPSVPVLAATALMESDGDRSRAALDHADGRPDRHPQQSDRGEQAGAGAWRRLVPPQRHHQGAVPASRRDARRLSGLPAAPGLRQHEPRPPHGRAQQPVRPSGQGRRRFGAEAPRVLRRISRRHGSDRRVLFADRRYRFRPPRFARRAR